jgi:hypothetical protein
MVFEGCCGDLTVIYLDRITHANQDIPRCDLNSMEAHLELYPYAKLLGD